MSLKQIALVIGIFMIIVKLFDNTNLTLQEISIPFCFYLFCLTCECILGAGMFSKKK